MRPRFTLADLERANASWGCNSGPGALAAICGLTLDEVRAHLAADWPGYTNPTAMFGALQSIGVRWDRLGVPADCRSTAPRWGLCRVQWEGPWTQPGVPMRVRYRFSHWIGVARARDGARGVFDINGLQNGSGWVALDEWARVVAPELARGHDRRASGGWHITHAIEVERSDASTTARRDG